MKYLIALFLFLFAHSAMAQLEYPDDFAAMLESTDLILSKPLENQYKKQSVKKNDLFNYQYAIKKKKGDLEIRYTVQPWESKVEALRTIPHISTINLVTTLASNDDDSIISYHVISDADLKNNYHADWGLIAYFRPKEDFSTKKHCKMLTLYSEGKGSINVFYLFDEISEELENQKFSVMFKPQTQ